VEKYAIGIDFGTESGRVAIVNVKTGNVIAEHVTKYKHGVITEKLPNTNITLNPNTVLQHPQDYIDILETSIPLSLKNGNINKDNIIGIGLDFTSSTILPVDEAFVPLCFHSKWRSNPHSWVKLWKHHAAQKQANRFNHVAKDRNEPWLKKYGGIISSEWMLPKVLEVIEESPEIFEETAYFIEASDWITTLLTGNFKRNGCSAGFKGMWSKEKGYVSNPFLKAIHPLLEDIYDTKLSGDVLSVGERVGNLSSSVARKIGLNVDTPVAIGTIDAHAGMLGSGVTIPNKLVLIMGTSTCHLLLSEKEQFVNGISGVVKDAVVPDYFVYEAGQAAVGDIFAWYIKECVPNYVLKEANSRGETVHSYLEDRAKRLSPGSNGIIALDWHNGCRTPLVDSELSGLILGLTLSTKPEELYRALIESTAFGTLMIIDQFKKENIIIDEIVACGGLPHKNELLMQIYSDVTGMPISVAKYEFTPAIGAAIYGAKVAGGENGGYDNLTDAARNMTNVYEEKYKPNTENTKEYRRLYEEYIKLIEYFGKGDNDVMKTLKDFRVV
jgi:L-ribulokinase